MPYFRLTRDGSCGADFLLAEGVDDGGFAGIWVPDESHGDLFAAAVESGELSKEGDESSFSERVGHAGVESEGGEVLGEEFDPFCLKSMSVFRSQQYSIVALEKFKNDARVCMSHY